MALICCLLLLGTLLQAVYLPVKGGKYATFYTFDGKDPGLNNTIAMLDQRIEGIQMVTGVYIDGGPDIYIVPDQNSYRELALGRQRIVEFSEAFYSSVEGRIYTHRPEQAKDNYLKILVHEYIHWYLDQIFELAPLWFHEGMAMTHANQLSYESYLQFVLERFRGKGGDLFRMGYQYPELQVDWPIYYLNSYFAVKYLQDKREDGWRELWSIASKNYREGRKTSFVRAFNSAFGTTLFDFNADFNAYTRRMAWQYSFIAVNTLVFALLPLLLIAVHRRRRRRMLALPDLPEPVDEEPEADDIDSREDL